MMDRNLMRSVMKTTIIYFALIAVVAWFTYLQVYIIPVDTGFLSLTLDTSNLFMPFMSLLILNYASSLVKSLLIGDLVEPLRKFLRGVGYTSFVWLISASDLAPDFLGQFGFTFFACSALFLLQSQGSPLLRKYNRPIIGIILTAAVILGVTFLLSQASAAGNDLIESYGIIERYIAQGEQGAMVATFLSEFFGRLNFIILLSGGGATIMALLGIARTQDDPYVSYVGGVMGENPGRKFIYLFLFFSYLFVFRGLALDFVQLNPQIMTVAEWAVVCLVSYMSYKGIRKYVEDSLTSPDLHGEWSIHVQEVERTTDVRLDNLSNLIQRFVSEGKREVLVVHLVDLLRKYDVSVRDTSEVISEMINFRERELGPATMVWRRKMIEDWNLGERRDVMDLTMGKMREVGLKMSYIRNVESASTEDEPKIEQEVTQNES